MGNMQMIQICIVNLAALGTSLRTQELINVFKFVILMTLLQIEAVTINVLKNVMLQEDTLIDSF